MTQRRRTFGPVVLVGLASGVLAAVAGNHAWAVASGRVDALNSSVIRAGAGEGSGHVPLLTALALVVLACWGVLLVTRGRVRRAVAVLAAAAALGTVVTAGVALVRVRDDVTDDLARVLGPDRISVHLTSWGWVGLAAAVVTLVAVVLAVRWVPAWPEMGSRYDAPVAGHAPADDASGAAATPDEQSSLDLWKAMDEGRDPTL